MLVITTDSVPLTRRAPVPGAGIGATDGATLAVDPVDFTTEDMNLPEDSTRRTGRTGSVTDDAANGTGGRTREGTGRLPTDESGQVIRAPGERTIVNGRALGRDPGTGRSTGFQPTSRDPAEIERLTAVRDDESGQFLDTGRTPPPPGGFNPPPPVGVENGTGNGFPENGGFFFPSAPDGSAGHTGISVAMPAGTAGSGASRAGFAVAAGFPAAFQELSGLWFPLALIGAFISIIIFRGR